MAGIGAWRGLMSALNILLCRGLPAVSCPILLNIRDEAGKGLH